MGRIADNVLHATEMPKAFRRAKRTASTLLDEVTQHFMFSQLLYIEKE